MPSAAPLRVLLFQHADDADVVPFDDAIVRAFQGGKEASAYLADGADLGIQLQPFPDEAHPDAPPQAAAPYLDSFCHTLTLVFIDRSLLDKGGDALWNWLADCWAHTDRSRGRHRMIALAMEERLAHQFSQRPGLQTLQVRTVQAFGESAIRPAMVALLALHEARMLLARALPAAAITGQPAGFLRLFISHAKADGLPLAQALRHQIQSIGWLKAFYDADDLPPGCNWERKLESGVGSSLIIMLRTGPGAAHRDQDAARVIGLMETGLFRRIADVCQPTRSAKTRRVVHDPG